MASKNEYRYWANRQPDIARARAEVCKMYREMRNQNPALARRLFVTMRSIEHETSTQIIRNLYEYPGHDPVGGLAHLLR